MAYRPKSSYRGKTEAARARQLGNLVQFREDRPRGKKPGEWTPSDFEGATFRMTQRILDTGQSYRAAHEPWQEGYMAVPMRTRQRCFFELARSHDKTDSIAFYLVERLLQDHGARTVVAAVDRDQARLFRDSIQGAIHRNGRLGKGVEVQRNLVRCGLTGSEVVILSADAPSSYGLKFARLVITELAQ